MLTLTFFAVLALGVLLSIMGRRRAVSVVNGEVSTLHSRPSYHAFYVFLVTALVGLGVLVVLGTVWSVLNERSLMNGVLDYDPTLSNIEAQLVLSDARAIVSGGIASRVDEIRELTADRVRSLDATFTWGTVIISTLAALGAGGWAFSSISKDLRARNRSEKIVTRILFVMAAIAIATTLGIILSLIFETVNFFRNIDWQVHKFLFGTAWSPLSGVHDGKLDADKVGAIPLFAGTMLITLIAMLVAVPVGLFAAIYLSDFAGPKVRAWAKPMLEILAGIPTVVYGFFAAITLAPFLRNSGEAVGLTIASESALAAGIVMGIMIIPFISSLSDDVINAVPQSLRDGSYGLGATKAETIRQVVLPAALPGIVSAVLLGISRAVGETMIVVMAAGQGANLTANPLEAVTTVTVQIVMLITGDTEASTAAGPAFTLGFTLFCVTLLMNFVAQRIVRRYREQYD